MFVVCEKWVETRTDGYNDPSSSLNPSSTSFAYWLGLLNRGSLRAQSPQSAASSHFGIQSPTDSNRPGTWLYYFSNAHPLPLFFRLFTQVHLLIDCSVEGQYITLDISLLDTQHYNAWIRGKWNNLGKGVAPSPTPRCRRWRKRELLTRPWQPSSNLLAYV